MGKYISPWITVKQPSKVKPDALYFIQRRGGYYKPNAQGYCDNMADAGVFVGREAKRHLEAEGVTLHPVKPLLSIIQKEMRSHIQRAANLAKLLEQY